MSRPTQELPKQEASLLLKLREAGPSALPQLRARVALLRDAGWSLAAVGAPLGANRSTTRMWQTSAKPDDIKKCVKDHGKPAAAPPRPTVAKTVRMYPDVPEADRAKLVKLAESARLVRGHTPPDSPARKAAHDFEQLLRRYHEELGVPKKRLAEHIGVTHRAIAARLERADERELANAS